MTPLTIVMPMHNAAEYVRVAIDSVLAQSFCDFTLLVINDGSDDDSADVVSNIRDSRIQIVNRPRCGLGSTLQFALEICSTPYLARMDADDISQKDRLAKQYAFLSSNPTIGAIGTQFSYFVDDNILLTSPTLPTAPNLIAKELLKGSLAIVHASMMFRTELLRRAGGYRISGSGEDWDMFLRLSEVTSIANLNEKLYWWRLHPGNLNLEKIRTGQLGIQYAIYCAQLRASLLAEPTFDQFRIQHEAKFLAEFRAACQSRSLLHYRRALCSVSQQVSIRSYLDFLIAGVLAPDRVCRRLSRDFRYRK